MQTDACWDVCCRETFVWMLTTQTQLWMGSSMMLYFCCKPWNKEFGVYARRRMSPVQASLVFALEEGCPQCRPVWCFHWKKDIPSAGQFGVSTGRRISPVQASLVFPLEEGRPQCRPVWCFLWKKDVSSAGQFGVSTGRRMSPVTGQFGVSTGRRMSPVQASLVFPLEEGHPQ